MLTKDISEVRDKTNEKVGTKSGKGEFVFEVVTPKRVYYFSPNDEQSKTEWMTAIRAWIGRSELPPNKEVPTAVVMIATHTLCLPLACHVAVCADEFIVVCQLLDACICVRCVG